MKPSDAHVVLRNVLVQLLVSYARAYGYFKSKASGKLRTLYKDLAT
jgi:hypothetical protein